MNLDHPKVEYGKTGVLIINLGTPDSTSWFDIRKYLKEFLSDKRVIEVNPILWQIILNVFILNLRPSKTAKAYKEIWMKEENMSPLLFYTQKQAEKVGNLISNVKSLFWSTRSFILRCFFIIFVNLSQSFLMEYLLNTSFMAATLG